jgi:hypothetical protein
MIDPEISPDSFAFFSIVTLRYSLKTFFRRIGSNNTIANTSNNNGVIRVLTDYS